MVFAPVDGRFGRLVDVPKVLAGRLPAAGNAGEIVVDQRTAAMMGLQVGSVLTMRAVRLNPSAGAGTAGQGLARPRLLRERVVGVVVTRGSVLPVNQLDKDPVIMASPALFRWLGVRYVVFTGAYVQLRPGASAEAFARRAQALARRFPATGGHVFVAVEGTQAAAVQRAIRPQAVALALFALALAVTALLIVGQAATRLLATGALNHPALAALGLTRGQLMAAGLIEVGAAAVIGAMVAAGVAVAASPLMPIGPARLAEPDPGVSADATGAGGWGRRDRGAAGGAGGLAGLAAGLRRGPRERQASGGPAVAVGGVAGGRRWPAGDRGGGGAAGTGARPRAHRGAGARRPGGHGTVGARGDRRVHLRREPSAAGQYTAAVRSALGCRDRAAVSHRRLPSTGSATFPASPAGRSGITAPLRSAASSFRRSD